MSTDELIRFYEQKKKSSRLWYLNAKAKAGQLLMVYGEMALAHATIALYDCSERMYWHWRTIVGLLQDLECP